MGGGDLDSENSIVAKINLRAARFVSLQVRKDWMALGPTQPNIQWKSWASFPEAKLLRS